MKERMTKGRKEIKSQYKSTIERKKRKKYLKESKIEWEKEKNTMKTRPGRVLGLRPHFCRKGH